MWTGKAEKEEIALQIRHRHKDNIKMDLEKYALETNGFMLLSR